MLPRPRRAAIAFVAVALLLIPATQAPAATIPVTSTADNKTDDGLCTVREAVDAANTNAAVNPTGGPDCPAGQAGPATDTIELEAETYELSGAASDAANLSGDLDINSNSGPVVLQGGGAPASSIVPGDPDRVIDVQGTGSVSIRDLLVQNGEVTSSEGGAIRAIAAELTILRSGVFDSTSEGTNPAAVGGGGILAGDGLTLVESFVGGNTTTTATGSGTSIARGGGIRIEGGATVIRRSQVFGNTLAVAATQEGSGGGIAIVNADGDLTVVDSTITSNSVTGGTARTGGGIAWLDLADDDSLLVQNSTFSENTVGASQNGGGLHISGGTGNRIAFTTFGETTPTTTNGAGYYLASGQVGVRASVFATETDDDCNSGTSLGHNVEQLTPGDDCHFNQSTDVLTSDPILSGSGAADNGGPTATERLEFGPHPAIDKVPAAACLGVDDLPLGADQRGAPRPFDVDNSGTAECDAGSYEFNRCQGFFVNRVGTDDNDDDNATIPLVAGTPGNDSILALGGNDTIDASSGDDKVCAGEGDDRILDSDAGDDAVDGGPGSDTFVGGLDAEIIDLAAGTAVSEDVDSDVLLSIENADGGFGNDTLTGGPGPNDLDGGVENDSIFARDGVADAIDCGAGADTAQTDRKSLEPTVGCETVDALAEPAIQPVKKKCKKGRKLKKVKGKFKCVKKKRKKK